MSAISLSQTKSLGKTKKNVSMGKQETVLHYSNTHVKRVGVLLYYNIANKYYTFSSCLCEKKKEYKKPKERGIIFFSLCVVGGNVYKLL